MDWRLQEWQKVYSLVQHYQQCVAMFSYEKVSEERTELFGSINGFIFRHEVMASMDRAFVLEKTLD